MAVCTCSQERIYIGCSLHSPHTYLSHSRFHRLIHCPRSHRRVAFSDAGDPNGDVTLVVLPSSCSRLVVAGVEPVLRDWGVRIVCVDRGGCGGTEDVQLDERVQVSTDQIVSVLEHLNVVPKSIIASSGGIYYALHLLSTYPPSLLLPYTTAKSQLPPLYLLAPWSPPLSSSGLPGIGGESYFQPLGFIPTSLIKVQHLIVPHLIPISNSLLISLSASSTLFSRVTPISTATSTTKAKQKEEKKKEFPYGRYWKKDGKKVIGDWIMAERIEGFGQEHLLCLSRGIDMGPKWFEEKLNDLGKKIKNIAGIPHDTVTTTTTTTSDAPNKLDKEDKLRIECWFGDKDGMVPIKGQEWLNKILNTREEIDYTVHKVKGGTHNDLIDRYSAFGAILERIGTQPSEDEDEVVDGESIENVDIRH